MRREDVIIPLVRGKHVLDIGSVGQSDAFCLWNCLSTHSGALTGIDLPTAAQTALETIGVSPAGVEHSKDPRITLGNMETISLGNTYDVAVAGDVIEHVSNQGLFLDNVCRHLEPGGRLIITTPNAKWPTVFVRPNPTHTLWHDRFTLRHLLERHGYLLERLSFYHGNKPRYPFWTWPLILRQQIIAVAFKP
jgi:2-polyprenyl-3-methyl-5-hydroxy-6-metoxy-1,4-benzoquinol methylase